MGNDDITRRDFVTLTVGAGLAASGAGGLDAQAQVMEMNVEIKTPDGTCDAAFIHPTTGTHPAVIVWPDAFGLRPSMREIGRRLAAEGYSVLVPNPFYRVAKAPVFDDASNFSFADQAQRAKLTPLMGSIGAAGAAERDAAALVTWLDAQRQVDRAKKIGTQGYCMGGALVVRTAAAVPTRIGAGASFHGGGLVTPNPDSPHLLASKIKARMYFGVAANDDAQQPDAKTKLKESFDAAKAPAIECMQSQHGWCVSDMRSSRADSRSTTRRTPTRLELLALAQGSSGSSTPVRLCHAPSSICTAACHEFDRDRGRSLWGRVARPISRSGSVSTVLDMAAAWESHRTLSHRRRPTRCRCRLVTIDDREMSRAVSDHTRAEWVVGDMRAHLGRARQRPRLGQLLPPARPISARCFRLPRHTRSRMRRSSSEQVDGRRSHQGILWRAALSHDLDQECPGAARRGPSPCGRINRTIRTADHTVAATFDARTGRRSSAGQASGYRRRATQGASSGWPSGSMMTPNDRTNCSLREDAGDSKIGASRLPTSTVA
jgi:carboxymethylenebutenolidase